MLARVTALQLIIMAIVGCCKLLILGVVAAFLTREFLLLIPIGDFQPSIPHCSYDGDYCFDVEKINSPVSLKEIQELVKHARDNKRRVRVVGAGHSRSPIALSEDMYISLDKYEGLTGIDEDAMLASFKGGTRIRKINEILRSKGFSLSILPAIDEQTIAGAISTGTHGSGLTHGNLATLLTAIQLVTGNGEVLNITKDLSPNIFDAVGVSLGLLGVITEVTLTFERLVNLEERRFPMSLTDCLTRLDSLMRDAEYVKLWIELNSEVCYVHLANRAGDDQEAEDDSIFNFFQGLKMRVWEVFQWLFSIFPSLTKSGMKALFSSNFFFPQYHRVIRSENVHIGRYYMSPNPQVEVSVPLEKCTEAIHRLTGVVEDHQIPVNHIFEVRFVKKDSFLMSNNYGRDSCHITLMLYNPSKQLRDLYFYQFYKATFSLGARPHWGKHFNIIPDELMALYSNTTTFLSFRKDLDPHGVFLNPLLADTFNISRD